MEPNLPVMDLGRKIQFYTNEADLQLENGY